MVGNMANNETIMFSINGVVSQVYSWEEFASFLENELPDEKISQEPTSLVILSAFGSRAMSQYQYDIVLRTWGSCEYPQIWLSSVATGERADVGGEIPFMAKVSQWVFEVKPTWVALKFMCDHMECWSAKKLARAVVTTDKLWYKNATIAEQDMIGDAVGFHGQLAVDFFDTYGVKLVEYDHISLMLTRWKEGTCNNPYAYEDFFMHADERTKKARSDEKTDAAEHEAAQAEIATAALFGGAVSFWDILRSDKFQTDPMFGEARALLAQGKERGVKMALYQTFPKLAAAAFGWGSLIQMRRPLSPADASGHPVWDLAKNGRVNIKGLEVNKSLTNKEILDVIALSAVFGKEAQEAFSSLAAERCSPADHMAKLVSCPKLPTLLAKPVALSFNAVMLMGLLGPSVVEEALQSNPGLKTAKQFCMAVLNTAYKGLLSEQELNCSQLVASPIFLAKALEWKKQNKPAVPSDQRQIPQLTIEGDGFVLTPLAADDIRNLVIGEFTSCCQKLDGEGEDVCTEGWTDTESLNYVFKSTSGTIFAHMWVFRAKDGSLVIDSIEGRSHSDISKMADAVSAFAAEVGKQGVSVYLSATSYGLTQEIAALAKRQAHAVDLSHSKTNYSYTDASKAGWKGFVI